MDENVSVFETTIRFLGVLLAAHMFLVDNVTNGLAFGSINLHRGVLPTVFNF